MMTWTPPTDFAGRPGNPALDPEVQALAKIVATVIHPSYKQTEQVFHRKAIGTAVAILKAGYRLPEIEQVVETAVAISRAPANPADYVAVPGGIVHLPSDRYVTITPPEPEFEYVAYIAGDNPMAIDSDTFPEPLVATHRRRKAGPWERVPPIDAQITGTVMFGADPLA